MEKNNAIILSPIIASIFFMIFFISLSHAFALGDLSTNNTKSNNAPHILILHNDRAFAGQLITLDASKSFDPDRDPIKFSWKKISPDGFDIKLLNHDSAVASFVAPPVKTKVTVLFELSISDSNGNTNTDQFPIIISKNTVENKKQEQQVKGESTSVMKKDQADKPKTKSPVLSSIDRKPVSKNQPDSKQDQLIENSSKSPILGNNNKIKVNAGKNAKVASGNIVTLHGMIVSNADSKQIKLSWTQKKGPLIQLSSNHVLDPIFIAPNVKKNERIELELVASDQNGVLDSDSMNVIVVPDHGKSIDNGQAKEPIPKEQLNTPETSSDTTQPIVVKTSPSDGATGITKISRITATFSEPMLSSSITTSTFTVKARGSSTSIPGVVWLGNGIDAYFAPMSSLNPTTTYVAEITTRAKDVAGNSLSAVKAWSFTTGYRGASTASAANTTAVSDATHAVNGESVNKTDANETTPTATRQLPLKKTTLPTPSMIEESNITKTINDSQINDPTPSIIEESNITNSQIIDSIGSNSSQNETMGPQVDDPTAILNNETTSFSTAAIDTTRPTVISTNPTSGATGVAVTSPVTATFSEPVQSWSSTSIFTVKNSAGTSFPGALALSLDRKTVTFTHSLSFAASTSYTVTITTGVKDLAGNTMASNKVWSFTTAAGTINKAGLYVPLFTYPTSSMWSSVISTKNSHPNLPMLVAINPSNGVGSFQDSNFVNGINQLKSAGITVIGYVDSNYGQRSTTVVQDEINKYKSWYGVNGIFFDRMSVASGVESYYSSLNSYVKSAGMSFTMGNPGADTRSSYIGTVDNIVIYESQGLPSIDSLKGWHLNYDKKNFSIISYGVSALDTQFISNARNYVGWIYVTNDGLSNPWDTLPSYFSSLAAALDQ
jgi:hypothetical protein